MSLTRWSSQLGIRVTVADVNLTGKSLDFEGVQTPINMTIVFKICADFAFSQHSHLSPYVCVCVLWVCINVCFRVDEILKKATYLEIAYFQSNGANSTFSTPWPRPSLSKSNFGILFYLQISRKWWEIPQTLLLPSNRKSEKLYNDSECLWQICFDSHGYRCGDALVIE